MRDITEIDKNFKLNNNVNLPDIQFYDVKDGELGLHGLLFDTVYRRMPAEIAKAANEGVAELHMQTSGGRLRFVTDSEYVALSCQVQWTTRLSNMPATGVRGFDLYVDNIFRGGFQAPVDMDDSYSSIIHFGSREKRNITIHFPLYNNMRDVFIGLQQDAVLEQAPAYSIEQPIVFYGNSITQGGCVSRPGNAYATVVSRELDADFINLGFSGSGLGEAVLAEYIADLPMSAFVMDYDDNAPTVEHLQATHEPFFQIIRKKNPDLPIVILSCPYLRFDPAYKRRTREVVRATWEHAKAAGDENVWFIDGETLWAEEGWDSCTMDLCHPNDLGHWRTAQKLIPVLRKALKL